MRAAAERLLPAGEGWAVRVRCSDRSQGDFGFTNISQSTRVATAVVDVGDTKLEHRRQMLMSGRWTWLRQCHGSDVVVVSKPGECAGAVADAAATTAPYAVLAVHTADCAPVVVAGNQVFGIAHAGWRGIVAGVIPAVVTAVRTLAASTSSGSPHSDLQALVGPVIRPSNYEFGVTELAAVAEAVGCDSIRDVTDVTKWGTTALDLVAAVRIGLRSAEVMELEDLGFDTADERFFSHRVRREPARQVTVARLEPRS